MKKKIIAVDFDGVICENKFPDIGPLLPGAVSALQRISTGYEIIIWTCRSGKFYDDMKKFLIAQGISFTAINEPIVGLTDFTNSRKIYADLYLDDRNFPGGFPGWAKVLRELGLTKNLSCVIISGDGQSAG